MFGLDEKLERFEQALFAASKRRLDLAENLRDNNLAGSANNCIIVAVVLSELGGAIKAAREG